MRAAIHIRGAMVSYLYDNDQARLERLAIRRLTKEKPGWGRRYPICAEIESAVCTRGQRRKVLKVIEYAEIPEDQHEWRKHGPHADSLNVGK